MTVIHQCINSTLDLTHFDLISKHDIKSSIAITDISYTASKIKHTAIHKLMEALEGMVGKNLTVFFFFFFHVHRVSTVWFNYAFFCFVCHKTVFTVDVHLNINIGENSTIFFKNLK